MRKTVRKSNYDDVSSDKRRFECLPFFPAGSADDFEAWTLCISERDWIVSLQTIDRHSFGVIVEMSQHAVAELGFMETPISDDSYSKVSSVDAQGGWLRTMAGMQNSVGLEGVTLEKCHHPRPICYRVPIELLASNLRAGIIVVREVRIDRFRDWFGTSHSVLLGHEGLGRQFHRALTEKLCRICTGDEECGGTSQLGFAQLLAVPILSGRLRPEQ